MLVPPDLGSSVASGAHGKRGYAFREEAAPRSRG
jgi:hypothetical protein